MQPDTDTITLDNNIPRIKAMLMELVLKPRLDLVKWATLTKQTPNMKIGYPGQHLASLVTGVEGERTAARGHDLTDGSEVKSCSRVDQLDKCRSCKAAVARIEAKCPKCNGVRIKRNNDSKWLFAVKSEEELQYLLNDVPRVVFIIGDYPNFEQGDWDTLRFQVFEIWPGHDRHASFRTLMENYYHNIYLAHIARNANKTPAPKNFWPYSYQFYMCNPVRTFHCIVSNSLNNPTFSDMEHIEPTANREDLSPVPMPISVLSHNEKVVVRQQLGMERFIAAAEGLDEEQRMMLNLRDTDHATPHGGLYRRGDR